MKKKLLPIYKKEQHRQLNYYMKLVEAIKNYQEVLLFGPADAKKELLNILRADHVSDKTKFELKNTYKITTSQMYISVREFFK